MIRERGRTHSTTSHEVSAGKAPQNLIHGAKSVGMPKSLEDFHQDKIANNQLRDTKALS